MTKLPDHEKLLKTDLDYICDRLADGFASMAGKNLLITGGAGFLGYYLIQAILHQNRRAADSPPIKLTVYDNYVRGLPDWLTKLETDANLTLAKVDMIQPLPANMPDFQYIIHAAGIASPIYYRLHPIRTMDANINGLRNLLDYCLHQKEAGKPVEGFLFYSSSEIYGDPPLDEIPTGEDYRGNVSCTGARACYDESKRYGETLCVNFARQHDLPVKIARPFNNYGPGLKITDRRVLPDFARDVLEGRDIIMYSDGSPSRTFCYIADAITGYYQVLLNGRAGEAYNIGIDHPEISMAELADKVVALSSELFGYQGKVIKKISSDKKYMEDNPNRRCPKIEKAKAEVGYNPTILVDEGLRRSLIWYSYNRVAEES